MWFLVSYKPVIEKLEGSLKEGKRCYIIEVSNYVTCAMFVLGFHPSY